MLGLALRGVPGEVVEEPVLLDPAEMGGCAVLQQIDHSGFQILFLL